MKPWSKLQKELYLLMDSAIKLQIHCSVYRMQSQLGSTDLPRYWMTLGKEIIFDYPKDFVEQMGDNYPYDNQIRDISQLFRTYIDTPVEELFDKVFQEDEWGLTDLLKAADRRIGKRRLGLLLEKSANPAVAKIVQARLRG